MGGLDIENILIASSFHWPTLGQVEPERGYAFYTANIWRAGLIEQTWKTNGTDKLMFVITFIFLAKCYKDTKTVYNMQTFYIHDMAH